ncbi:MAG: hypothetical protein QNL04_07755 [SAR324 cluster bacterium]|nr:hypothetical protein [SAR324 cluster bacterium]
MSNKYAIVTETRQGEAFRVGLGLILLDDEVEIFVVNHPLSTGDMAKSQYANIKEMEIPLHFVGSDGDLSLEELSNRLTEFTQVIPFY